LRPIICRKPRLCRGADEFFFTPSRPGNRYIALAHSRNYGLPALPRAFFSSRITGKDALGLHEKEFAVPVTVRHPLDDFAHGLRVRPQSPVGASLLAMAASLLIKMSSSLQDISYQKRRKHPQIFKVVARKRAL
jgi:hypothetical protein